MKQLILFISLVLAFNIHGQKSMIIPPSKGNIMVNHGSELREAPLLGTANPGLNLNDFWDVTLYNLNSFQHVSSVSKEELVRLKSLADERRNTQSAITFSASTRSFVETPELGKNFRGNERDNSVPPDNSMAISRNGFIVSGINSNIVFMNASGVTSYKRPLPDFFSLLDLGTRMYDPRIIYDVEQNRFIVLCLNGSDAASTHLCLAFSKTEDPNGEWFYYKVDGNPDGDDNWFDYPNVAVSQKDLYISGLMRNLAGDWQYSVMYQIDKVDGLSGSPLTWKHYNALQDADGSPSFNLVPTPSGWNTLIGPGMYFVSNVATGGDKYNLFYTDESVDNNPKLVSLQVTGLETELAPNGRQKGTNQLLNTFDSRIWSAMYLNGSIHFGGHVMSQFGTSGILYGRMNIANLSVDATIYAKPDVDFGFPSFTAFGKQENDTKILVNHLVSGTDMFPSQEVMVCDGVDTNFLWSEPIIVHQGDDYVDALPDNYERWGDYTTSCRRFTTDRIECWITGCFGEQKRYGTWHGQLVDATQELAKDYVDFTVDKSTTQKNIPIRFTDITSADVTTWKWSFPGAVPSTSTNPNPLTSYPNNGIFNVTLEITTSSGENLIISKPEFIHIVDAIIAPIADFTILEDTLFTNDTAYYKNTSLNNPITFSWTLSGATPNKSTEENPKVIYKNSGNFGALMIARNVAGSNTKVISKVVNVLKRSQPEAIFTSDKTEISPGETITFFDQSINGPSNRLWSFPGGTPESSTIRNPLVSYSTVGVYDVTLKVSNDAGEASLTIPAYITVGSAATQNHQNLLKNILLFPNPGNGDRITLTFEVENITNLQFSILDENARSVKRLFSGMIKTGKNELSFSPEILAKGNYFLLVEEKQSQKKVALPFIILK